MQQMAQLSWRKMPWTLLDGRHGLAYQGHCKNDNSGCVGPWVIGERFGGSDEGLLLVLDDFVGGLSKEWI
jgi:hypothetical protein